MRLAVFRADLGARLGAVDGDQLVDLTDLLATSTPGPAGPLHALLEQGDPRRLAASELTGRPRIPLAEVRLDPPLPRPGKILGAPVNYRDHQTEMAAPATISDLGLFLKAPSSVLGPGGAVALPYSDLRTDQEAELAVVIGREARDVPAERALDHVAGYSCLLDITVRSTEDRSTRKSFDTFTPLGPWLTTPDEVGDPGALDLRCWVGGTLRQSASTAGLIFGVPELVAYASSVMTLWPGDVIATGTPAGVGPIRDGDRIAVEIQRVGRLEVTVTAARARPYASRPGRGDARNPGSRDDHHPASRADDHPASRHDHHPASRHDHHPASRAEPTEAVTA
ncbi:fumarylacetoacetate hydrolase family protein [Plantactinospora sp. GCM10030261]|uniref:fumarylacetoacetate hydrolase family protein n=1 Tax=Plantactinospora sp. GCM10030261 TaxID=3273420 RepID=UPI00361BA416